MQNDGTVARRLLDLDLGCAVCMVEVQILSKLRHVKQNPSSRAALPVPNIQRFFLGPFRRTSDFHAQKQNLSVQFKVPNPLTLASDLKLR